MFSGSVHRALQTLSRVFALSNQFTMSGSMRPQGDVPAVFKLEPLNSIDLFEVSIPDLQKYMSDGKFSSAEYVSFCLERIRKTNPYLESVIEVNPDAIDIATELDKERADGNVRGPLHGVPVLVKDNTNTYDKMETTCGSWALLGAVFPREAFVVTKLRDAGAVILGHANMNEWASMRSTWYSDGYSPRGGQVRNPYDLSKSPFGSSAGSAVSVAANIVPLTFATETDGSVAGPAQINAVVGIKPTPGLTSRDGVIPTSETMDTVGPIARTVRDAVLGLEAIVGEDAKDPLTSSAKGHRETNYTQFISTKEVLKGAKFGLPVKRAWSFVSEDQRDVFLKVVEGMQQAGAEIIDVDYPSAEDRIAENGKWDWELGGPSQSEFSVIKVEAYNTISHYLAQLSNTEIKKFEDIINFNEENTGTEGAEPGDHPAFATGQDILRKIAAHKGEKDQTYHDALAYIRQKTREEGIDGALKHTTEDGKEIQLDALILCDRRLVGQQIAAQAGYPTITLPVGVDKDGMPVGMTLQQTAWAEGTLIRWASAIEDVRNDVAGGRSLPTYRDHLAKNVPIGRKHITKPS